MPKPRQNRKWLLVLVAVLFLSGCASQSRKASRSLDTTHEAYSTDICRDAQALAPMHDDIKLTRTLASPGLLMLGGASLFVPTLLINMGLDVWDRLDASSLTEACGGHRTPRLNIMEDALLGVGFDLFTGRLGAGR